jgi:hypothetical protein
MNHNASFNTYARSYDRRVGRRDYLDAAAGLVLQISDKWGLELRMEMGLRFLNAENAEVGTISGKVL